MRKHLPHGSRLALVFVSAVGLVAQTQDITPFTGTWKLNVAKSKFSPGPGPQSETLTVAPDGAVTIAIIDSQGQPHQYSYPWSIDKEVPIQGIENATVITKLQGRTADRTLKVGGKIVDTAHAVVSPDGKTITVTAAGTDRQGRQVHSAEVFDKQ